MVTAIWGAARRLIRLLLDKCVLARLARALPNPDIATVVRVGWSGIENGKPLALAASRFDALVMADKNLCYQQNPIALPLAVGVRDAQSDQLCHLLPLVPSLETELKQLRPGYRVGVGHDA